MKEIFVGRVLICGPKGFLLIRRSKTDSFDHGKWEIAGGKSDLIGRLTANETKREIEEETGINDLDFRNFMILEVIIENGVLEKYENTIFKTVYFLALTKKTKVQLSHEHDDFCWVKNWSDVQNLNLKAGVYKILEKVL